MTWPTILNFVFQFRALEKLFLISSLQKQNSLLS